LSIQSGAAGTLITNKYLVGSISTQSVISGDLFVGKSLIFASWTELEGSWTAKLDNANKKYAQTLPNYYRHLIYRLELRLKRFNNPGNLHIEIRENDGTGEEWYPTGTLVAQTDFDTSGIDTAELEWVTICLDLSGWLQEILGWTNPPNEKRIPKIYGIVLSCPGADATNYIEWQYDSTGGFENGRYCYYDGASWSHQSGIDFYFIEYGCRKDLSGIILPALPQMLSPALTCSLTIQNYKPIAPFIGGEYKTTLIGDTIYESNFPFSLFEFEYAGNIIRRYFNDFYYRIHIIPRPINLGLILTNIESEFWVWNAFFITKTLEVITIEGNLNLVGQSAPYNFRGLEVRKYAAKISKEGVPDYKAEITFDFADPIEEIAVIITGLRAAILFWRPESKIKETLEWKTAILRAHGGKEQRIKLRQTPRQFFKLQFIFGTNKISSQFDAMLHRWQKRFWIIPIWTEYTIHSEILSEGAISIDIDTRYADFRDDSFAMIWKSALEYEVVVIDSVDVDKLNLKAKIINNYVKGQYILPIRTAYMISKNIKRQYNSPASMIETLFAVTDNVDITGYTSERTLEFAEADPANTGNGDVNSIISANEEPTEIWELTCTTGGGAGVGKFSVIGSISGDIFNLATVGAPYNNGKIAFTINDDDPDFVVGDNFQTLEVLITPSYMTEIHQEESDGLIDINDFETGIFRVRSDKEFNLLAQNHIFYNDIKKTSWELRQFLHWFNGRQRTILIPTYRNDLVQKDIISAADKFLYIENIKLAINMGANELRTYIGFYFPDKTLLIRKITKITEIDETKEKIDINSSLGKTVNLNDCKICFVDKCRLASDRIEINWPFAHRNECRSNLIRVP